MHCRMEDSAIPAKDVNSPTKQTIPASTYSELHQSITQIGYEGSSNFQYARKRQCIFRASSFPPGPSTIEHGSEGMSSNERLQASRYKLNTRSKSTGCLRGRTATDALVVHPDRNHPVVQPIAGKTTCDNVEPKGESDSRNILSRYPESQDCDNNLECSGADTCNASARVPPRACSAVAVDLAPRSDRDRECMRQSKSLVFTKHEPSPSLKEDAQEHAQYGRHVRLAKGQENAPSALYAEDTHNKISLRGSRPLIRSPWLMENDVARLVSANLGGVGYTAPSQDPVRVRRGVNALPNCNDNGDPSDVTTLPSTSNSVITNFYERNAGPWLLQSPALTILVAEDNYVHQKILEKSLQKYGWKMILANHGGEAMNLIKKSIWRNNYVPNAIEFDAVAMDTSMPVMPGMDCILKIRRMEQMGQLNARIPIVGMLVDSRPESVQKMFDAGMVSSKQDLSN